MATSSGPRPGAPTGTTGGPLPPARMAVRFGRSGGAGRFRRRLVGTWVVVMAVDALVAWGAWGLPLVPAVIVLALTATVAAVATSVIGLLVAVVSRASVAAGDGWVGYRVLGRWRVVRHVLPEAGAWSDDRGPAGPPGPPPEVGSGR